MGFVTLWFHYEHAYFCLATVVNMVDNILVCIYNSVEEILDLMPHMNRNCNHVRNTRPKLHSKLAIIVVKGHRRDLKLSITARLTYPQFKFNGHIMALASLLKMNYYATLRVHIYWWGKFRKMFHACVCALENERRTW